MTDIPDTKLADLVDLYDKAAARAALPHRSPSHRIAEQLAATAEAHAYASALALLTGDDKWQSRARNMRSHLRVRLQTGQSDIDSAEHAEGKLRRYGLHYLP